jgi:hypothetical protein
MFLFYVGHELILDLPPTSIVSRETISGSGRFLWGPPTAYFTFLHHVPKNSRGQCQFYVGFGGLPSSCQARR